MRATVFAGILFVGAALAAGTGLPARAFSPPEPAPAPSPPAQPGEAASRDGALFGAFSVARTDHTRRLDETELDLFIRERALDDVLRDIAQIAGLRLRINDRLDRDQVARTRLTGNVRNVLDTLSARHNLVWFAERDLVDVSRADTASVKTFQIGRMSDTQIRDAIARFGLVNADFALEVDESNAVARIFAPPRLSARLESIIVGLRPPAVEDTTVEVIRFGLRQRPGE
jgi:hypothetical protein